MATDKQIAANRANAAKSTGPRSTAGKKRISRNAVTHGLTSKYSSSELTLQVEKQARQIASEGNFDLEPALIIAEAELELARVRRVQIGLTERVSAMGSFAPPKRFSTRKEMRDWFSATRRWICGLAPKPLDPVCVNPADTMPSSEQEREAEALRRALPELMKLWRYERRALARRNRGIKALIAGPSAGLS
jgi:hypothetical protein